MQAETQKQKVEIELDEQTMLRLEDLSQKMGVSVDSLLDKILNEQLDWLEHKNDTLPIRYIKRSLPE